ncbi:MAG TPA: hypothetical protein VKG25_22425 [Bryobacteraceae bacterium]|nr:hypothetical protein [Bryobacteraceae bacterium]
MKRISIVLLLMGFVSAAESLHKTRPSWLTPYSGANVTTENATETSFDTRAKPEDLIAHYRKLITGAGLPFVPNFDGIGTSIRAATPECDLLIKIRESDLGSFAKVNCPARAAGSASPLYGEDVGIVNPEPPPPPAPEKPAAAAPDEHEQKTPPASEPEPRKQLKN